MSALRRDVAITIFNIIHFKYYIIIFFKMKKLNPIYIYIINMMLLYKL